MTSDDRIKKSQPIPDEELLDMAQILRTFFWISPDICSQTNQKISCIAIFSQFCWMVIMETVAVTKVLLSDFSTCFHVLKVTRFHCRQMAEQKVILMRINDHFVSDYLKHTKLKVCEIRHLLVANFCVTVYRTLSQLVPPRNRRLR